MCDTFGIIRKNGAIFGKNSDRSPNEPQVIQWIKGHKTKNKKKKVTYIEIDEVKEVYSILISRPSWMWGCEMGVNEFGVCIGNEAIFTKGKYNKTGLTGMDLVRLGLERSKNAKEAVKVITNLLKKYNQGGNCGYDHNFYYDNSFLIMDRRTIYILETSKTKWQLKETKQDAISNCLVLRSSKEQIKENILYTYASKAKERRKLVKSNLEKIHTPINAFQVLRLHQQENVLEKGSVSSPCMHAGSIIGDHTTSSMVVDVKEDITVYFTASSTPCLSLFKRWKLGSKVEKPICTEEIDTTYWHQQENIKRKALFTEIPKTFYEQRDQLEKKNLSLSELLIEEEKLNTLLQSGAKKKVGFYYKKYWEKKNKQQIIKEEIK